MKDNPRIYSNVGRLFFTKIPVQFLRVKNQHTFIVVMSKTGAGTHAV